MAKAPRTTRKSARAPYLDSQSGWRIFVISLLIAAILGLGFRLYFSPSRLKSWVQAAIEDQKKKSGGPPFAISFERVDVSLSRGWIPEFALVLTNLKVAPRADCRPEASVFAGRLRLPLRLRSLALGRAAIGVVTAEDLVVDLDGLRAPCEAPPSETQKSQQTSESAADQQPSESAQPQQEPKKPWWRPDQYEAARANVEGIEFSRATLQFENRTKEVYLDSFEALIKGNDRVSIDTEMRIPPSVAHGETIPPLRIDGEASSEKADLAVTLRVSEGSLVTNAAFTPAENQTVHLAANLAIKSLPLSMMTPLMRKAGLVDDKFNPRFMWLDCSASISGPFQGLFQKQPLKLTHCQIEGDGADLRLESASREPGGAWSPFEVDIVSLEISKLLTTVGVPGPESLLAKQGRLQGRVDFRHVDDAVVSGTLRNIDFVFSNQNVRALQRIESVEVMAKLTKNQLTVDLDQPVLRDGVLDGTLHAEIERPYRSGTIDLVLKKLALDPAVQTVLVGGHLGEVAGDVKADFSDARITRLVSSVHVASTQGTTLRFERLDLKADQNKEKLPRVTFESPMIEVDRASPFFQGFESAFLGHEFTDDWVPLKKVRGEVTVLDEESQRAVFAWPSLSATLDEGQILVRSAGRLDRDRKLSGTFSVDFPAVKNLTWQLGGTSLAPKLFNESETVKKFKARVERGDSSLGLKTKTN